MKLLVDVGNTNINLGISNEDGLVDHWRLHTNSRVTPDELWNKWTSIVGDPLEEDPRIVVSSVVPEISRILRELDNINPEVRPFFVEPPWDDINVNVKTDRPEQVGADRVAGALAFSREYEEGIIVDFGTATTVDFVDSEGSYRGGVIVPGVRAAEKGLHEETALLPRVSLADTEQFGFQNTQQAIKSGLLYGTAGSVSRIISEFRSSHVPRNTPVVATGGHAELFLELCPEITDHDPQLVLKGLHQISKTVE